MMHVEMLHKGVEAVINNDRFHVQTTTATSTLKVASDLRMWMEVTTKHKSKFLLLTVCVP